MKKVVVLMLIVAAASANSDSSKSKKHEMRQAHVEPRAKYASRISANLLKDRKKSQTIVNLARRAKGPSPPVLEGVFEIDEREPYLNPDPNLGALQQQGPEGNVPHSWTKRHENIEGHWGDPDFCQPNSWVHGMSVYQDDTYGDEKGVTYVELFCKRQTLGPIVYPHMIKAGHLKGDRVPRVNCNILSWFTGIRIIYDDQNTGVVQLVPICQIPNYTPSFQNHPPNDPGYYYNVSIAKYNWETHQDSGWEVHDLKCEDDKAVCGLATRDDWRGLFKDEAGVTGLIIFCCHFTNYPASRRCLGRFPMGCGRGV